MVIVHALQDVEAALDQKADLLRQLREAQSRLREAEGPARKAAALREQALTAEVEVRCPCPRSCCTALLCTVQWQGSMKIDTRDSLFGMWGHAWPCSLIVPARLMDI